MKPFKITVTSAFGIEGLLRKEMNRLGYEKDLLVDKGGVTFWGTPEDIVRCNLWIRQGERVLIEMGRFTARSFEELFQGTLALPWEDWIGETAAFPVAGKSAQSTLFSVPDCQAIVKKAIVERLKQKHQKVTWFEETGPTYQVEVKILKDVATLVIDTSGMGLHKRGYRKLGTTAPLKETLAAVMLTLSNWRPQWPLIDPFCGSGTIPIEAAMKAMNMAPGLKREFVCETWPQIDAQLWKKARREAEEAIQVVPDLRIEGYDLDQEVLSIARYHAKLAGVEPYIHFQQRDVRDLKSSKKFGSIITNPIYGERLANLEEAAALYRLMGEVFSKMDTWSFYILTSHPDFERHFGKKATKNTKLFNGRLECRLYQYHGPRPPREARQTASEGPEETVS